MTNPARVQGRLAEAIERSTTTRRSSATPTCSTSMRRERVPWRVRSTDRARPRSTRSSTRDKRTNIPTADAHEFVDPAIEEIRKVRYAARREPRPAARLARQVPTADEIDGTTRPRHRRAADLHPGEDRPARPDREPPAHRREARGRARADALRRPSTGSTNSTWSTSTSTTPTGRTA